MGVARCLRGVVRAAQWHRLVWLLTSALGLSVEDLVVATVCLECYLRKRPALIHMRSARPLLLTSCVLAIERPRGSKS